MFTNEIRNEIICYTNTVSVGYQRCYQSLKEKKFDVTEWQTRIIYESEGLYLKETEYQPKLDDRTRYVTQHPNQLWHTDLHIFTENGKKLYLIAFLDDRTRYILYYSILQNKEMINTSRALVECIQTNNTKPSKIVIDNGSEFIVHLKIQIQILIQCLP